MSGMLCMLVGSSSAFNFNATISANTTNYNLNTAMTAAGWNGIDRVIATVTVNSSVYVGSTSTSNPAFTVGVLPTASTVSITNNGYILGKGGNAGTPNSGVGQNGGPALTIGYATTITNNNIIGGGGGGGGYGCGAGAYAPEDGSLSYMYGGGGGGGAGYDVGSGGSVSGTRQNAVISFRSATNGSPGTYTAGGGGGVGDYGFAFGVSPNTYMAGGGGGAGGGLGASGGGGGDGSWAGEAGFAYPIVRNPAAGSAGAGGYCTTTGSNAYITWAVAGTRYGTLG